MQKLGIVRRLLFVVILFGAFILYAQKFVPTIRMTVTYKRSKLGENNPILFARTSNNSTAIGKKNFTAEYRRETAKRFADRLKFLHSKCPPNHMEARERSHWVPTPHFLVDVPRRILICVVPKSGSSTWHGLMWSLRRKRAGLDYDRKFYVANDTVANHAMAAKLSEENGIVLGVYKDGDENIINGSTVGQSHRLILARHPFARLISGWKDKFRIEHKYWREAFKQFPEMKKYRVLEPPTNFSMAFEDLARYIAENGLNWNRLEYHFMPAHALCKPCNYAYTYILKAEWVDEDQPWLLDRLNLTDIRVLRRGVSKGTLLQRNPSDSIKEMFKKLPSEVVIKLFRVYETDFRYFGYTFNFDTLESGGFD